ncbi:MAG: hypothetical protein A2504_05575 [Bdellovibrionales bacterium RIFOXYD12_FULL_39_22]|nr:MAG: hypothetical protein A2385_06250 [Bdellovibrionales bacterium RIFOXYB1_FULL_39_21]OFZ41880.1 MAG: hypothetical protein A2485_08220 [Bdellovibrionales bacterium RIFOXYC12_FULL_39_17]OFZ50596.1 MAG: hypothetical protein A2404_05170 [Bdellovibrionales bacterium RIFOXYC1_FULL_39_130]OFZ73812.1 MAG: hypothetical protein A2451_11445 [Bdellovibrionales bacterium RIFOXYC2_FULL_39_8]OFZ77819.1 MAG: hypothetical protein A2560_00340 [Bdellovibrionales bacterium RIFOXYD1_FULL_39_84]OFZ93745.1 MAG:
MVTQKSVKNKSRKGRIPLVNLDITSVLDIVVITMVFLIQNYNATGELINIPKEVVIPNTISTKQNSAGVIVQVSPSKIWVDDTLILDSTAITKNSYDREGRRIVPLFNELVRKKELIKQIKNTSPNAVDFTGRVNLVMDKSIKFDYVKKLLYTAAEAGYSQYKFIVLGVEQ